jgi:hypothetical protein
VQIRRGTRVTVTRTLRAGARQRCLGTGQQNEAFVV